METACVLVSSQDPPSPLHFRRLQPEKHGAFLGNSVVQFRTIIAKDFSGVPQVRRTIPIPPIIAAIGRAVGEKTERELAWISANRHLYANRWIALHGDTLLAVGDTAREVYRATAGYPGVPLVIQVEPLEGTNFAGW